MKKKRQVWYTGCFSKQEYNIRFSTHVKILAINTHLFLIRQWRRFIRLLGYCKYSMMIIPLWALYICVISLIGSQRTPPYTVLECIWDIRTGFFTSIVVAGVTSIISGINKHKNIYQRQHTIYLSVMNSASDFIKELTKYAAGCKIREHVPHWPLYDENSMSDFATIFVDNNQKVDSQNKQRLLVLMQRFRKTMDRLTAAQNSNSITDCNWTKLQEAISEAYLWCDILEDTIEDNNLVSIRYATRSFVTVMFSLVEMLRYPWRRDHKSRKKILELIIADDPTCDLSYPERSLLNLEDYELYTLMSTMDIDEFKAYIRKHYIWKDEEQKNA